MLAAWTRRAGTSAKPVSGRSLPGKLSTVPPCGGAERLRASYNPAKRWEQRVTGSDMTLQREALQARLNRRFTWALDLYERTMKMEARNGRASEIPYGGKLRW